MLYNLLYPSAEQAEWMQSWLTVPSRAALAFFAALALGLLFGGRLIEFLHHHQKKGQPIREDGPQSHLLTKKGTPTMGGLLILGTATAAILLFSCLLNPMVWVCLAVMWIYGVVGFADELCESYQTDFQCDDGQDETVAAIYDGVGFGSGHFLLYAGGQPLFADNSLF